MKTQKEIVKELHLESISDIVNAYIQDNGAIWIETQEHVYSWNGEAFDLVD